MIQEARTVGLTFLYSTTEGCDKDDAIYVFIHRFSIVRMRFTVDMAHGIFLNGNVEQIGHIHYKEGEFSFDASPKGCCSPCMMRGIPLESSSPY